MKNLLVTIRKDVNSFDDNSLVLYSHIKKQRSKDKTEACDDSDGDEEDEEEDEYSD